jgi:ABC-type transport system involved in cytochrome c biogenesis ATPase subunit
MALKVTVTGRDGEGKSSVLRVIAQALSGLGMDVSFDDSETAPSYRVIHTEHLKGKRVSLEERTNKGNLISGNIFRTSTLDTTMEVYE